MSTNRVEKFMFSVNFTRPHENNSVAFADFSTLESLHFHRKLYIVFVWTGKCKRDDVCVCK